MKIKTIATALLAASLFANGELHAKAEKTTSTSKSLIEKTAIIIPRDVEEFELVNFDFDKNNKSSGVQLRYVSSKYPAIAIDFFVFPMGTGPVNQMLKAGMQDFTDSLKQAEEMGYFEKLAIQTEQDLILNNGILRVASEQDKTPKAATPEPGQPNKNVVLASIEKSLDLPGKKIALNHIQKNTAMQSLGYLFYRQLYLTKVRATIKADELSSEEFNEMTDHAVSRIVTAIEARNIGSCSDSRISIKVDDSKKSDALSNDFMEQLMAGLSQNVADNCVTDLALGKIPKSDFEVVTIEYTPEDWGN